MRLNCFRKPRTLRLAEFALLNTGLQRSVEERVEGLVSGGDVVVGLDVFLQRDTAVTQKRQSVHQSQKRVRVVNNTVRTRLNKTSVMLTCYLVCLSAIPVCASVICSYMWLRKATVATRFHKQSGERAMRRNAHVDDSILDHVLYASRLATASSRNIAHCRKNMDGSKHTW
jgi:hypothetical protein